MTGVVGVFLALAFPYVFYIAQNWLCYFVQWVDPVASSSHIVDDRARLLSSPDTNSKYGSTTAIPNDGANEVERHPGNTQVRRRNSSSVEQAAEPTPAAGQAHETVEEPSRINVQSPRIEGRLLKILAEASSSRDFCQKSAKTILTGGNGWEKFFAFFVTMVLLAVFLGWISVGITSAVIASDGVGLLSSSHCGVFQYDDRGREDAGYIDDLHNRGKEERSAQYAQQCYGSLDAANAFTCKVFNRREIKFKTKSGQPCPFVDDSICYSLNPAVTFDTGIVNAEALGINAPNLPKWRRKTTCSPLNMSTDYITSDGADPSNRTYYYKYGDVEINGRGYQKYTTSTSGRPYDWIVPVYHVEYVLWEKSLQHSDS